MSTQQRPVHEIGEVLRVNIEKVAHGGHFIARHQGAVFFVRHAIPGEVVDIRVTGVSKSFYEADVVAVIESSSDRITPPCRYAGTCGGCDFLHINIARQRSLKGEVIAEQFARIAKMEVDVEVEEVSAPIHWRTRYAASTGVNGEFGFKAHKSADTIAIGHCPVLLPEIDFPTLPEILLAPQQRVEVALSSSGERTVALMPARESRTSAHGEVTLLEGDEYLHYQVSSANYRVSQSSFWQSNINAPQVLVDAVLTFAQPQAGEHFLDLYGGVGLFTGALIDLLGAGGRVDLIEGSESATRDAKKNFSSHSNVHIHFGDVARNLKNIKRADVVLLDPPRIGAGEKVIDLVTDISARAIIYIACDPAALARDTVYLQNAGYRLANIRAFDLFPQTHHIESIALYLPNKVS